MQRQCHFSENTRLIEHEYGIEELPIDCLNLVSTYVSYAGGLVSLGQTSKYMYERVTKTYAGKFAQQTKDFEDSAVWDFIFKERDYANKIPRPNNAEMLLYGSVWAGGLLGGVVIGGVVSTIGFFKWQWSWKIMLVDVLATASITCGLSMIGSAVFHGAKVAYHNFGLFKVERNKQLKEMRKPLFEPMDEFSNEELRFTLS